MIKTETVNGNRVVFINRQGVRIAPTYNEIRNMISELIEIYGKEEVYQKIGMELPQFESEKKLTYYKGIDIVWLGDINIFKALEIFEKEYPAPFKQIISAGVSNKTLILQLEHIIESPLIRMKISSGIFWDVLIIS